jgi:hypothetical protein
MRVFGRCRSQVSATTGCHKAWWWRFSYIRRQKTDVVTEMHGTVASIIGGTSNDNCPSHMS